MNRHIQRSCVFSLDNQSNFRSGVKLSKKMYLILAIAYAVVGLILNNVLQTTVGGIMMTLSIIAFVVGVIGVLFYIVKFNIGFIKHKHKN